MDTSAEATPARKSRLKVRDQLAKALGSQYSRGTRLPSVRELAAQFGASPGTIHRAVQDLTEKGLLIAKERQGVFIAGDTSVANPQDVRQGKEYNRSVLKNLVVDVIYHQFAQPPHSDRFVATMVEGFEAFMQPQGLKMRHRVLDAVNCPAPLDLRKSDADAIAIFNHGSLDPIQWARHQAVVVVQTADEMNLTQVEGYDWMGNDQHLGGYLAGRALRACGISRAAFLGVGTNQDNSVAPYRITSAKRLRGFLRGWGDEQTVDLLYGRSYSLTSGARAAMHYVQLDTRPKAVFAASDELAIGFINGATAHGLRAGQDYYIIGFDGQQRGRDLEDGPLTTIEVPAYKMGYQAGDLLLSRLLNPDLPPRRVAMGSRLLQGATTPSCLNASVNTSGQVISSGEVP